MGIKKKLIAMFFVWALFLLAGSQFSIADNRIYMTGTFLLVLLLVIFSGKIWKRVQAKMNWDSEDRRG